MSSVADVAFHTGLPDKIGYACRLLRKAWRSGVRVLVTGTDDELSRLDQALWVFDAGEFIPHLRLRAGERAAERFARTPIWLCADDSADVGATVLVNLGPDFARAYAGFERVVELVAADAADAEAGRQRWRRFVADGVAPVNRAFRSD